MLANPDRLSLFDRSVMLPVINIKAPTVAEPDVLLIAPRDPDAAAASTDVAIDFTRALLKINHRPIDAWAMEHGFDLEGRHATEEAATFRESLLGLLKRILAEQYVIQIQAVFDQWLCGHLSAHIKTYFHGKMQRVFWIQNYADIYVEDDVLKLRAGVYFTHVQDLAGREDIFRFNSIAITESTFRPDKGFIVDNFYLRGLDRESLAAIYRLPLVDAGVVGAGPVLNKMSKAELRSYLAREIYNNLFFTRWPVSSQRELDFISYLDRPTPERPIYVKDFLYKSNDAIVARVQEHLKALIDLEPVLVEADRAAIASGDVSSWRNILMKYYYRNFPARARLEILLCLLKDCCMEEDLKKILAWQERIVKQVRSSFSTITFNAELVKLCSYMNALICDAVKKLSQDKVYHLQKAWDIFFAVYICLFEKNSSQKKLWLSLNMLFSLIVIRKASVDDVIKIANEIADYADGGYASIHKLRSASLFLGVPKMPNSESWRFQGILGLITIALMSYGEIKALNDKDDMGYVSTGAKALLVCSALIFAFGMFALFGGLSRIIHDVLLDNYCRSLIRQTQATARVFAPAIATPLLPRLPEASGATARRLDDADFAAAGTGL